MVAPGWRQWVAVRMLSAAVSREGGGNASKTPNQALFTPTKKSSPAQQGAAALSQLGLTIIALALTPTPAARESSAR